MARLFDLTDGTLFFTFINTGVTGVIAQRGGFGKGRFRNDMDFISTPLQDGAVLRSARRENVVENYALRLKGSSHDNAALVMQQLHGLLLKAEQYHLTSWQLDPVYLRVQTTNETGTRHALVYGSPQLQTPDFFDQPFESSDEVENIELQLIREPYWRDTVPGTLPTELTLDGVQEPDADGVEQFVSTVYNPEVLTHVFVDDGGVFGSNLQGDTSGFDLLPATPAVGDALYMGDTNTTFFTVLFDLDTLASGVTGVFEIWTGAAFSASVETRDGADGTNDFEGFGGQVGNYCMYLGNVDDWATTSVNGVTAYWLRFRVTAVASPSPPHQNSGSKLGIGQRPIIEYTAARIDGDADAMARLWFSMKVNGSVGAAANAIGEIIGGVRTRFLGAAAADLPSGYINLGAAGALPLETTLAFGTDTATFTNTNFPQSTISRCTFATVATILPRTTITVADARAESWQGSWQVYFLGYQTLGSAKDVEVELGWGISGVQTIFNGLVPMQRVETDADDEMMEVVNLGRIDIPPAGKTRTLAEGGTPSITEIKLALRALSNNGSTPNLHMCALMLIPIDEMSFHITRPDVTQGTDVYAMTPDRAVVMDGGLVGEGVELLAFGSTDAGALTSNVMDWMLRSDALKVPPDKQSRIFFLPIDARDPSSSLAFQVSSHSGFFVRLWVNERWHTLRGAD